MNIWLILYTITTTLSLIGQIVIVILYFDQKKRNLSNVSQDILFRMAISDSIFCIGQLQMLFPNSRQDEEIMIRCMIYAFCLQFGTLSMCFNCFCLCLFSFKSLTQPEKIIKKYANWSLIFCFGVPFIIATIITSLKDTESGEYTCFVAGLEKGQGAIDYFVMFYVPLIFFMLMSFFFVLKSYLFVLELKRQNGIRLEIEAAERILKNMMFYPVVFLISWSGYIIERIQYMVTKDQDAFKAEGFLTVLNNSQGLLNFLVYLFNYIGTRKLIKDFLNKDKGSGNSGIVKNSLITESSSIELQESQVVSIGS